jgi:hypothetical protein
MRQPVRMRPATNRPAGMWVATRRSKIFSALLAFALLSCSAFLGCSGDRRVAPLTATINENASLSAADSKELPANPLQWRVITSSIDPQNSTMSTLYGNNSAIQHARSNIKHDYPPGSQIALVTWTRRDDPRYFGAKIPDRLKSIEFVFVTELPGETKFTYEKFEGAPLAKTQSDDSVDPSPAATALLNQRAAVLP